MGKKRVRAAKGKGKNKMKPKGAAKKVRTRRRIKKQRSRIRRTRLPSYSSKWKGWEKKLERNYWNYCSKSQAMMKMRGTLKVGANQAGTEAAADKNHQGLQGAPNDVAGAQAGEKQMTGDQGGSREAMAKKSRSGESVSSNWRKGRLELQGLYLRSG
jgi:hypothetical protein